MRCVTCSSTGYTEEELLAHEKKSGHKRPADGSHTSNREFPKGPAEGIPRNELIAALKALGFDGASLDAMAAKAAERA